MDRTVVTRSFPTETNEQKREKKRKTRRHPLFHFLCGIAAAASFLRLLARIARNPTGDMTHKQTKKERLAAKAVTSPTVSVARVGCLSEDG